jgi:hypothetical protein
MILKFETAAKIIAIQRSKTVVLDVTNPSNHVDLRYDSYSYVSLSQRMASDERRAKIAAGIPQSS